MDEYDDDLAGAATASLSGVEPDQDMLEGTDTLKVKFVGVQYDSLDFDLEIGQEMSFIVEGRVVGVGTEEMADGHRREYAKFKVRSVVKHGDE